MSRRSLFQREAEKFILPLGVENSKGIHLSLVFSLFVAVCFVPPVVRFGTAGPLLQMGDV